MNQTFICRKPPEVWNLRTGDDVTYVGYRLGKIGVAGKVIGVNPGGVTAVVRFHDGELMGACSLVHLCPTDPQEHNYSKIDPIAEQYLIKQRAADYKDGLGYPIHRRSAGWGVGIISPPRLLDGAVGEIGPVGDV